jgi:hypothetical protein
LKQVSRLLSSSIHCGNVVNVKVSPITTDMASKGGLHFVVREGVSGRFCNEKAAEVESWTKIKAGHC